MCDAILCLCFSCYEQRFNLTIRRNILVDLFSCCYLWEGASSSVFLLISSNFSHKSTISSTVWVKIHNTVSLVFGFFVTLWICNSCHQIGSKLLFLNKFRNVFLKLRELPNFFQHFFPLRSNFSIDFIYIPPSWIYVYIINKSWDMLHNNVIINTAFWKFI